MELFIDFLKIILPATLVLYAMYLTFTSFLNKDFEKKVLELRTKNSDIILPIRLQAYERIILFLERITPNNLIIRVNNPSYSSKEFQQILLKEIREEFNHNLSQQVYVSDKSWILVRKAVEDLAIVINNASKEVSNEASGLDLTKKIFETIMQQNTDITSEAISFVKKEIQQTF
ncbi:MAG TPA: hypothetical protein VD908_06005 [Cytophagales bacterium]|nr:hypothetical protein [Cytophagales bacterium]